MAYSELTCDHVEISTEALIRGAMVKNDDGTWSLQVVDIGTGTGEVEGFDYEFDSGLN